MKLEWVGSRSRVRHNWANKINSVNRSCYAVNGSQFALQFGDAQSLGTGANQHRCAALAFGRQRKVSSIAVPGSRATLD